MSQSPPPRRTTGLGSRQNTGISLFSSRSRQTTDQRQDAQNHKEPDNLVEDTFPVYRLGWDDLKTWLENRFPKAEYPELTFHKELSVKKDKYVFKIPCSLTTPERTEIEQLRVVPEKMAREQSAEPAE